MLPEHEKAINHQKEHEIENTSNNIADRHSVVCAELSSLKTFAKKMNLDLSKNVKLLNQAGYGVKDKLD